jgi:CheY-specific phosphatase CheX
MALVPDFGMDFLNGAERGKIAKKRKKLKSERNDVMVKTNSYRSYILASLIGAVGGGLIFALATKAIPKMMSRMMAEMPKKMMARMRAEGVNPEEF